MARLGIPTDASDGPPREPPSTTHEAREVQNGHHRSAGAGSGAPIFSITTSASLDAKSSRTASRSARRRRTFRHKHPGEEVIYVLEGTLQYGIDGQPPITASAGDALTVPAETVHGVRNVGTGNAAELATYVVEKGKSFLVVVD